MSKLYTEEQVRGLLNEILILSSSVDDAIDSLTPIELPSDEEIEKQPIKHTKAVDPPNVYYRTGFKAGAKWMKEQILNQNK